MPGPTPKPAALRQRRNKQPTAATMVTDEQPIGDAPSLGKNPNGGKWHSRTLEWWTKVWESPMADEFLWADVDGLLMLASLIDQFWHAPSSTLATEIRLQRQCYGLTPIDRRRLQWEIVRAEEAERKSKRPKPQPKKGAEVDPREALRLA